MCGSGAVVAGVPQSKEEFFAALSATANNDDEKIDKVEMVRDWADTIGIPSEYLPSNLNQNFDTLVENLYMKCLVMNNVKAAQNLEKKIYRNRLKDILES